MSGHVITWWGFRMDSIWEAHDLCFKMVWSGFKPFLTTNCICLTYYIYLVSRHTLNISDFCLIYGSVSRALQSLIYPISKIQRFSFIEGLLYSIWFYSLILSVWNISIKLREKKTVWILFIVSLNMPSSILIYFSLLFRVQEKFK